MTDQYSSLMNIIRNRRSIRRFLDRKVPDEYLDLLVDAARWAPSAGNRQNYRFFIIKDPKTLTEMSKAVKKAGEQLLENAGSRKKHLASYIGNFSHFENAPVTIAVIYRQTSIFPGLFEDSNEINHLKESAHAGALSSVSAAITNLLLAAHALDLGACWMTGPLIASEKLEKIIESPKGWKIAALIPVGYPDEKPAPPPRRSLDSLIRKL